MWSPQIIYKDDLNWLKGIGCYAWDTPEIVRVKHAGEMQSEVSPFFIINIQLSLTVSLSVQLSANPQHTCHSTSCFIRTDVQILVFLFQNKYRSKGIEAFKDYSVVTDTPVYETSKQNAKNLSDVRDYKCLQQC